MQSTRRLTSSTFAPNQTTTQIGALAFAVAGLLVVSPVGLSSSASAQDADAKAAETKTEADAKVEPAASSETDGAAGTEAKPAATETPATETPPAEAKPRLLVTELVNQGADENLVSAINAAITSQARGLFKGEVTSTQEVRAKLEVSAAKVLSGCQDDACYFNAAKVIGAEKVLGGSVSKVGEDLLITLIVINGRDGSRVTQIQRKTPPMQELAIYSAAQSTAIAVSGAPTQASVPVVIRIKPGPEGAEVLVDGESRGAPPVSLSLSPGSHNIEIRASGVPSYRTTVTVEAASPILIEAKLGTDRLELWPVAVGMGVASAVVIAAGIGFGAFANLNYDGTVAGIPLGDADESYVFKSPATSVELAEKEQAIGQFSAASNTLTILVGPALAIGAVGFLVADFVLGSSADE